MLPFSDTPAAPTAGTTLAILAAYLPYGIEVEEIDPTFHGPHRHQLRGLDLGDDYPVLVGEHPSNECSGDVRFRPSGLLPVLRPFPALALPLPGGEVPIEQVLLLLDRERYEPRLKGYIKRLYIDEVGLMMEVDGAAYGKDSYCKPGPGKMHIWGEETKPAIIDYLRRNHFACPIAGQPLLPGRDYVALGAAEPA